LRNEYVLQSSKDSNDLLLKRMRRSKKRRRGLRRTMLMNQGEEIGGQPERLDQVSAKFQI
jgi:hypothetical protein